VNELIEESCVAASRGENPIALEKAKEAGRKERLLVREREKLQASDSINLDLTYSVSNQEGPISQKSLSSAAFNSTFHTILGAIIHAKHFGETRYRAMFTNHMKCTGERSSICKPLMVCSILNFCFVQVLFNLATQYAANEMYQEAIQTYQAIVKNKMFSNAGMLPH
jgi:hypothetical protein